MVHQINGEHEYLDHDVTFYSACITDSEHTLKVILLFSNDILACFTIFPFPFVTYIFFFTTNWFQTC